MKKYLFLFVVFVGLISLYSCSDSNSSSPAVENISSDFFDLTNITNFTFNESRIDSLGGLIDTKAGECYRVADSVIFDSVCTVFSKFIAGVAGQSQICYTNSAKTECFIYSDCINDLVYKLSPYGNSIKFPFELPPMWVKIGDKNLSSWSIYSQQLDSFVIVENTFITSGTLTINAKRGATGTMAISDSSVKTQEFIVTFNYKGTLAGQSTVFDLSFDINYYFAEHKGIVKTIVPFTILNFGIPFPINGYNYIVTSINNGVLK
jgi:hypothetical protein